ncbi:hypothetical protein MUK70_11500 [Dyadobacter chenwenxiniae]|uniref:Uncharacterized protein n=1 Tax=Dyadobacter chenwenxiniae TaxID=2906456 RepID=A0A9X1PHB3_9BACT|nr:hypothetical protein [Dyadobacter chenwenxiniae]MCF0059864.1 hypothetical protein [Dyadobacter chenwenxiniae]UON85604.1 hypothetical protein MUK70_11500 [Dyadobacter chenwenxiniae]
MKKLKMLLLLLGFAHVGFGQTFKEWFRQKKTQKKYLIEQIAQLKIYLELTEKGYKIAKEGLTMIGDINNVEFKLHKNHFDSLKVVNPKIASLVKVKWIGMYHGEVKSVCSSCVSKLSQSEFLTSDELAYLRAVFDRLSSDCDRIQVSLKEVTTDGSYAMTDNDRIKRVEDLYQHMLFNFTFSKAFCSESAVLAAARIKEKEDVTTSRALRGIK